MQKTEDRLLVTKLKEGSAAAFEILYERYSAKLYNSISSILYDKSLAKDITQNCFLTIWERRELLDPQKQFSAYLYTIARNMVYKETERLILNNKYTEYRATDSDIFNDDTIEKLDNTYIEDYINQLIGKLSDVQKNIFLMKKDQNLSAKEIATELNLSERAVEAHLYRTMKFLKEKLKDFLVVFL